VQAVAQQHSRTTPWDNDAHTASEMHLVQS